MPVYDNKNPVDKSIVSLYNITDFLLHCFTKIWFNKYINEIYDI